MVNQVSRPQSATSLLADDAEQLARLRHAFDLFAMKQDDIRAEIEQLNEPYKLKFSIAFPRYADHPILQRLP